MPPIGAFDPNNIEVIASTLLIMHYDICLDLYWYDLFKLIAQSNFVLTETAGLTVATTTANI